MQRNIRKTMHTLPYKTRKITMTMRKNKKGNFNILCEKPSCKSSFVGEKLINGTSIFNEKPLCKSSFVGP